jgi:hypothetical protein
MLNVVYKVKKYGDIRCPACKVATGGAGQKGQAKYRHCEKCFVEWVLLPFWGHKGRVLWKCIKSEVARAQWAARMKITESRSASGKA